MNPLEFWKERSRPARAGLVLAAAAILACAAGAAYWALRTDYQPLFTELDPRDASAITAELDRLKVPYAIGEDGSTILVDSARVHATRLKVMGKGLDLKGTVGFEIFNSTDFGMTEFAQKINYQRALQGELARTIGALEEVKSARVHLVLPESGLLRRNAVRPKASVTLALRTGQRLQPAQIQGIQRLIAAAVPEMEPAAVTVLDQQGIALSRRADAEGAEAGGAQLDAKREIETYLARKVVAVLDQAFGPGRAIVSVDVALSQDQVKVTREDVLPAGSREGAVLRRKETSQRSGTASLAATDGTREAPRAPAAASSEVEYQHGRRVEQVVSPPGGVRRISVGVLLPQDVGPGQAESLKAVIANAVGLSAERGDAIAFSWVGHSASSPEPGAAPRPAPSKASAARVDLAPEILVGLAAVALIALVAALIAFLRRRRAADYAPQKPLSPQERDEMLARLQGWLSGAPQQEPRA